MAVAGDPVNFVTSGGFLLPGSLVTTDTVFAGGYYYGPNPPPGEVSNDATAVPEGGGNYMWSDTSQQDANLTALNAASNAAANFGMGSDVPLDFEAWSTGFWARDNDPNSLTFNQLSRSGNQVRTTYGVVGMPRLPQGFSFQIQDDPAVGAGIIFSMKFESTTTGWSAMGVSDLDTQDQGTPGNLRDVDISLSPLVGADFPLSCVVTATTPGIAGTYTIRKGWVFYA